MLETSNFSASLGVLTGCGDSPIRLVGDNTNKGEKSTKEASELFGKIIKASVKGSNKKKETLF